MVAILLRPERAEILPRCPIFMMTSSNRNISALLAICATQKPVTRIFDVFFDLHPNKRLSKQWRGWWFETQSCSLWRHCNVCFCFLHRLPKVLDPGFRTRTAQTHNPDQSATVLRLRTFLMYVIDIIHTYRHMYIWYIALQFWFAIDLKWTTYAVSQLSGN